MELYWENVKDQSVYEKTMDYVFPNVTYRWDVINYFIEKLAYTSYLEIGLRKGQCFNKINCSFKRSIDPLPTKMATPDYIMTSDEYFAMKNNAKYDVIFIDGKHEKQQFIGDVYNSLKALKPGGMIFCHDVNVHKLELTRPESSGDVWKGWVTLRHELPYLMYALPFDYMGVIDTNFTTPGKLTGAEEAVYTDMAENRKLFLNLIDRKEFNSIYKGI